MLEPVHRLGRRLTRLRPLFIVVGLAGGLGTGIGLLVFPGREGDAWAMPALLMVLWAALLLVFADLFAHLPPPSAEVSGQYSAPLRRAALRVIRWMVVGAVLALGATTMEVSFYIAERWVLSVSPEAAR